MLKFVANLMIVAFGASLLAGCGGASTPATSATNLETATDVADMLKEFCEAKKVGPANIADLEKLDASVNHPLGQAVVARQDFVVFWRVAVSPANGDTVLAYDKDTPGNGGAVVMGDGKVKSMTAEEFNAAKKAGTVKK